MDWDRIVRRANAEMGRDLPPLGHLLVAITNAILAGAATLFGRMGTVDSLIMTVSAALPSCAAFLIAKRRDAYNQQGPLGFLKYLRALSFFIMLVAFMALIALITRRLWA